MRARTPRAIGRHDKRRLVQRLMLRGQPRAPSCVDAMCEVFAESLSDSEVDISHPNLSNAFLRIVTSYHIGNTLESCLTEENWREWACPATSPWTACVTTGTCSLSLATTTERQTAHPRACCLFVLGLTLVRLSLCLCLSLSLSVSVAGPPQPDGVHPADAPNSRHRWQDCTKIHHPHPLCDAPTPAVLRFFRFTGCIPLFPDRTHERRQFFRLVGWIGTYHGWHTNRAGPRRPGHERRAQAARSTAADASPDAKEVPQNRHRTRNVLCQGQRCGGRHHGGRLAGALTTRNSWRPLKPRRPTTTPSDVHSK